MISYDIAYKESGTINQTFAANKVELDKGDCKVLIIDGKKVKQNEEVLSIRRTK